VHGLAGWGEQEVSTFRYWGMGFFTDPTTDTNTYNVRKVLSDVTGKNVYSARVGPFSSVHERACELYAQIRGLQTDYGATRASLANHTRFAPTGTSMDFRNAAGYGWIPNWGTLGNSDKIHFVTHSYGGPTVRLLQRYLIHGKPDETSGDKSALFAVPAGALYQIRHDAIKTHSAVSGLHDGSNLHTKLGGILTNLIKDIVLGLAALDPSNPTLNSWNISTLNTFYDFDLAHHTDLARQSGQTFFNFLTALINSPKWLPSYKYLAHYDLGNVYAYAFNVEKTRDVYNNAIANPVQKYVSYNMTKYLAIATSRTSRAGCCFITCFFNADYDDCAGGLFSYMEGILQPTGALMGDLTNGNGLGGNSYQLSYDVWNANGSPVTITFTEVDEENDGLVSRISNRGPHVGLIEGGGTWTPAAAPTTDYTDSSYPRGKWMYRDFNYDHVQAVGWQSTSWTGWFLGERPITDIYKNVIGPFILAQNGW
jgi:hypothetical protein